MESFKNEIRFTNGALSYLILERLPNIMLAIYSMFAVVSIV